MRRAEEFLCCRGFSRKPNAAPRAVKSVYARDAGRRVQCRCCGLPKLDYELLMLDMKDMGPDMVTFDFLLLLFAFPSDVFPW